MSNTDQACFSERWDRRISDRAVRIVRQLATIALTFACSQACAAVSIAGCFGDHMVVQRDIPIAVWGWADAGEVVTVGFADQALVASTTANAEGAWRVQLPPRPAGGPLTLTITGSNIIRIQDVLIGEVWLCSGQSNMEMGVGLALDFPREQAQADDTAIRQLLIPKRSSPTPQADLQADWTPCSPQTIATFTACGYFMARQLRHELNVPIGLINATWGGTCIEPWTPATGFDAVPSLAAIATQARQPGAQAAKLYNGMLHALAGYGLRGAIWYQGESNHLDGMLYADKMRALIAGWREAWGIGDFPVHYVQIAPYAYGGEDPSLLPGFWRAQSAALAIPGTAMAVISDIGDIGDIHPRNKQEVGRRLALIALSRTYGRTGVVCEGPACHSIHQEDQELRVTFTNAIGLTTRDGQAPSWFEVVGTDGDYVPAQARIDGDAVLLSSPLVAEPVAMRFAWHRNAQPNLTNAAGLTPATFAAGTAIYTDPLPSIADANAYTQVYAIDLSHLGSTIVYDSDASEHLTGSFDRIAYLLELQAEGRPVQYAWVAMDAFTTDIHRIGIPSLASRAAFQRTVDHLTVTSNVAGVNNGLFATGSLEFWPDNYVPANGTHVPGASDTAYDYGDARSGPQDGYGSMQIHNPAAGGTVFAINHWTAGGGADLGIGNRSGPHPDWTFAANAGVWTHKQLRIFVRPVP